MNKAAEPGGAGMAEATSAADGEPRKRLEDDGFIRLRGVRVNNLKSINLDIPRGRFIAVSGVSGSGKSSLAFDTLYAEGQRRYVESLSAYARQFLGRMGKPDADFISGIPPAIAIEQRVASRNPRSTVATSTEIYEYLRLLFARIGHTVSPVTGSEIKRESALDVVAYALSFPEGSRVYILSPVIPKGDRAVSEELEVLQQAGYTRLLINGVLQRIADLSESDIVNGSVAPLLVIDRLVVRTGEDLPATRLADSADSAFFEGQGECHVRVEIPDGEAFRSEVRVFSDRFEEGGILFREPSPRLFSFNSPAGACPVCEGFGKVTGVDEDLVIPNKNLSIYENAAACWVGAKSSLWLDDFIRQSAAYGFPIHRPYNELTESERNLLWHGSPAKDDKPRVEGIEDYFAMLRREMHKIQNRVRLAHFRGKTTCPACHGARLAEDVLCVRIAGLNISQVCAMSIARAEAFFRDFHPSETEAVIAKRLLLEIRNRLGFLMDVGLSYLTLDRSSATLSGGESQRICLATQLGSSLVGSLYVLDEPSIGLHRRDTERLLTVLHRLRDLGNTVLVVEHDEEVLRAADYLIDIGPDAGNCGGEVVYAGSVEAINRGIPGHTAAYLSGRERIAIPEKRRAWNSYIEVSGARKNNLKDINVRFPLHALVVVSGVSGSGKSSLVRDVFYQGVRQLLDDASLSGIACRDICGDWAAIGEVQYVDQNTIGRSTRSNPATYVGAYDEIRALFSDCPLSKRMGYLPYYFSFNKEGGRCEHCKGDGFVTVEMQFMADINLLCDECRGKRFRKEILEVEYHNKTIYDVLQMTVNEAIAFFGENPEGNAEKVVRRLRPLQQVGLGYIKLGQNSSSLSGGENQRVKLAYYLGLGAGEPTLFIFDEPTTGLHFHDINILLKAFDALIERGHSIVVVEHNPDVIKCADYLIDLGPEGGIGGGKVVAAGSPEEVAAVSESLTGQYLKADLFK